jgi:hypothetical protein
MNPDWDEFFCKIQGYPAEVNEFLPPCSTERIEQVEKALGKMPSGLVDMLSHFNGAKLFQRCGPMLNIFGITPIPALHPMEWAEGWNIDKFTPKWRAAKEGRETNWAIGITNYGGVIILDQDGTVREWDTAQTMWDPKTWDFAGWIDYILAEGEEFMNEPP